MTRKGRKALLAEINQILFSKYNTCPCPLNHESPFQLLVAVELSAQCTDIRVNVITKELFKKYPDIESLAKAPWKMLKILFAPGDYSATKLKILSARHKA